MSTDARDEGPTDAPASWTTLPSPTKGTLRGVFGRAGDVWICQADDVGAWGTTGAVLHGDGASFSGLVPTGGGATTGCTGVWGSSASDVWFAGVARESRLHYDGATLALQSGRDDRTPTAIAGVDATHVFAVGVNVLDEWDGATWNRLASGGVDAEAISATSRSIAWTAGPELVRWDGMTPTSIAGSHPAFHAVFAAAPNLIFVAGDAGTIAHFDGSSLVADASPVTTALRALWGTGAHDVFGVGDGGVIVHFDGTSWTASTSGTSNDLLAVSGDAASGDVWAVGAAGTILRARR